MGRQGIEPLHDQVEQTVAGGPPGPGLQAGQHLPIDRAAQGHEDGRLRRIECIELGQRQLRRRGDVRQRQAGPAALDRQPERHLDDMLCRIGRLGLSLLRHGRSCSRPPTIRPCAVNGSGRPRPEGPGYLTAMTWPPVMATRSWGVRRKTELGVPAAAQISACWSRSWSMRVTGFSVWPTGATPPMAKPVLSRTKVASALAMRSPTAAATSFSSARLTPLAITSTARFEPTARKTTDFAICATVQPIAAAASAEVRVVSLNSLISGLCPTSLRA